jgi:hypothetical protein
MAIFGIGATYETDVSPQFIKKRLACVGWDKKKAQPLHSLLKHIKIGDLIYIKSHPPSIGLIIKAVGIVTSDELQSTDLGTGIPVKWLWTGEKRLGQFDDKYPVRNITLYEEYSRKVQGAVVDLLLLRLDGKKNG